MANHFITPDQALKDFHEVLVPVFEMAKKSEEPLWLQCNGFCYPLNQAAVDYEMSEIL